MGALDWLKKRFKKKKSQAQQVEVVVEKEKIEEQKESEQETKYGRIEKELELIRKKLEDHHDASMQEHGLTKGELNRAHMSLERLLDKMGQLKPTERAEALKKAEKAFEKPKTQLARDAVIEALMGKNGLQRAEIKRYIQSKYDIEIHDQILGRALDKHVKEKQVKKSISTNLYYKGKNFPTEKPPISD